MTLLIPHKNIGVLRVCGLCGAQIVFCLPCNRGHRYCGSECAQATRKRSRARSRARYLQSDQGKEKNREHQLAFRRRRRKISVSDQSSLPIVKPIDTSITEAANTAASSINMEEIQDDDSKLARTLGIPTAKPTSCKCCGAIVTHYLLDEGLRALRRRRHR